MIPLRFILHRQRHPVFPTLFWPAMLKSSQYSLPKKFISMASLPWMVKKWPKVKGPLYRHLPT